MRSSPGAELASPANYRKRERKREFDACLVVVVIIIDLVGLATCSAVIPELVSICSVSCPGDEAGRQEVDEVQIAERIAPPIKF